MNHWNMALTQISVAKVFIFIVCVFMHVNSLQFHYIFFLSGVLSLYVLLNCVRVHKLDLLGQCELTHS